MIPASTTKIWKKKIGLPSILTKYNYLIQNNNNNNNKKIIILLTKNNNTKDIIK